MAISLYSFLKPKYSIYVSFLFSFTLSACIPCQTAKTHKKKKAVAYITLHRFYIPFILNLTLTISRGKKILVLRLFKFFCY